MRPYEHSGRVGSAAVIPEDTCLPVTVVTNDPEMKLILDAPWICSQVPELVHLDTRLEPKYTLDMLKGRCLGLQHPKAEQLVVQSDSASRRDHAHETIKGGPGFGIHIAYQRSRDVSITRGEQRDVCTRCARVR